MDGDVERSRRLVGDEQARRAGKRDRDRNALAHAARHLVRILARAPLGLGDAELAEESYGPRHSLMRAEAQMLAQRLGDLAADGQHGIE